MTNSPRVADTFREKKLKQSQTKATNKKDLRLFEISSSMISSFVGAQTIGLFVIFKRYCIRELESYTLL